ncbi:MAG: hypothetical protein RBG13Loki_3537 [Promethearchaeota archaeon CR_4]|nr:MAG: hypothetical protein RBG13Loki_3537 [Candidatus Lokiarchaeota archaeon CR_4]
MMIFNFWDWYGALNPMGRISVTILAVTLGILAIVGVYYIIYAIVKGTVKGTKAATKTVARGVQKIRQKIEEKKPLIREKMEQVKYKINATIQKGKKALDEVLNGKSTTPVPEVASTSAPINPVTPPNPVENPIIDYNFEFPPEKLPQYCPHCGALFTETMSQRVSHDRPAFCGRCGLRFVPSIGISYKKLVDEVLQPQ